MKAELLEAVIPCEAFEVIVQYGPEEALSPLEIEVIHAIHAGYDTLPQLVDLYKLGNRPMFDLVAGLWKAEHVFVNFHGSTLHVDETLIDMIAKGKVAELNRTEVQEKSVVLMQELLTGAVLPLLPHARMGNAYRVVPQLVPFSSYRNIDLTSIAELVLRQAMRRTGEVRPVKVFRTFLQPKMHASAVSSVTRRLMQLRLSCGVRHGSPMVEIVSPATIDGQVRRDLEAAIGKLAQERPDDPFSRHLVDRVKKIDELDAVAGTKTLEHLLADLSKRVDGLRDLNPADRRVGYQDLHGFAELAQQALRQRRAGRADVRLLVGQKEAAEAVEESLRSAKSQIVLCSPRATWAAARNWWSLIEQAVLEGASLFLLWGESRQSVLDPVLERNLVVLAERNDCSERVHWCRSGLSTNESFLVTDRRVATLSTFGLLEDPRGVPELALAVRFEHPSDCEGDPIAALLERVRRNALDHAQAQALEQFWVFGDQEGFRQRLPAIPDEPGRHADGPVSDMEFGVYCNAWKAFVEELLAESAQVGDCIELMFDGRHRQVLMQALEDRPSSLLLASRTISPDAITAEVVKEANECLKQGAQVSIIYNKDRHSDGRSSDRLGEFTDPGERLQVTRLEFSGGVVATDAFAVLSGFHFLGVPGFLLQESGQRKLEAGILVHSTRFARRVAQVLGHRATATDDKEPVHLVGAKPVAVTNPNSYDLRDLQAMVGELHGTHGKDDARPVKERLLRRAAGLALEENRWNLFSSWVRHLDDTVAIQAVATLLAQAPTGESPRIREWRLWLARERWSRGHFVEAAVLLAGLAAHTTIGVPTFQMAKAAAANSMPLDLATRGDLLMDALEDGADADRVVSWICIASVELIVHGVPDAAEVLDDLATRSPLPWGSWCGTLVGFWKQEQQGLPMERFEAMHTGSEMRDLQEEARRHLDQSITKLEQVMQSFHFTLGRRVWADLSTPAGWIGSIRAVTARGDAMGAGSWLERLNAERTDPETMLLDAEERVYNDDPQAVGNKRIDGFRRTRYAANCKQVIDATQAWVDKMPQLDKTGTAHHMDAKARALGKRLGGQIALIEADPGHARLDLARPVYEAMKKKLEVLWTAG